jgi:nucleoside-diphosphate-sugar epimerase
LLKKDNKRVLITGASGFVGCYVAKALLAAGYEVSATCRKNTNFWRLEDFKDKIQWLNIEATDSITKIFEDTSFAAIIHLATDYGKNGNYNEPDLVYTNILFPLTLFTAASQKGVKLFINTDTFYNLKYSNLRRYTLSKKHFLDWLNIFSETYGVRVINMRLFHVYGPLDSDDKFVPSILRLCMKEGVIPLTSGQQIRDFIYVSDVADAFLAILAKELKTTSGGLVSLDVGTGRMCSIREFIEKANCLAGGKATLAFGALPNRCGEDYLDKPNLEGISIYGWSSATTIDSGIGSLINWLKNTEATK